MTCLANFLLPSIWAASPLGPKHGIPAERTASATPATSGASGPMTTSPIACSRAQPATATGSSASSSTLVASPYMPPFPGAT